MTDVYRVKAPVVKVSIGSLEGNRVARILRAGAVVPEGVAGESLEYLVRRGFIEKTGTVTEVAPSTSADTAGEDAKTQGVDSEQLPEIPARSGSGSGAEAWRNYAAKVGVGVPADASRDDVIVALEAAGKPTE